MPFEIILVLIGFVHISLMALCDSALPLKYEPCNIRYFDSKACEVRHCLWLVVVPSKRFAHQRHKFMSFISIF